MRLAPLIVAAALAGCATVAGSPSYHGKPVADAVATLGDPDGVTDHASGTRYFTWSTSDVRIGWGDVGPSAWTERAAPPPAPIAPVVDEELVAEGVRQVGRFAPAPCTFTLAARWDEAVGSWVAYRAIRRGAGIGGRCGMRN